MFTCFILFVWWILFVCFHKKDKLIPPDLQVQMMPQNSFPLRVLWRYGYGHDTDFFCLQWPLEFPVKKGEKKAWISFTTAKQDGQDSASSGLLLIYVHSREAKSHKDACGL